MKVRHRALALVVVLSACAPREPVEIFRASVAPASDGKELRVELDSCNQDYQVAVEEGSDMVTLRATAKRTMGGRGSCTDAATVPLSEPLEDRQLVDGHTGETIAVGSYP